MCTKNHSEPWSILLSSIKVNILSHIFKFLLVIKNLLVHLSQGYNT